MMLRKILLPLLFMLAVPFLCSALSVGLNDDVHFDYPGLIANDFHIEGTVFSKATPKVVDVIIFGDGGNWMCTGYTIVNLGQDKYYFTIDFKTDGYIVYCQWIHFGIKFDIDTYNIIVDLKGYWTLDGRRITNQDGDVGITGFNVDDINMLRKGLQTIRLSNNSGVTVKLISFEIAVADADIPLKDLFIDKLGRPGEESPAYPELKWITIPIDSVASLMKDGADIDIFLETLNVRLLPGQFLIMRGQQLMADAPAPIESTKYYNNNPDWGYFWEIHQAPLL